MLLVPLLRPSPVNPRFVVQGRLGARCRSVQALEKAQAAGLLRTAQWQRLPPPERQCPALPLWESQTSNLKDELDNPICLERGEGKNFRNGGYNDCRNGECGGVHWMNGTDELRLLIHFKRSDPIIQVCQLRLGIVL